MNLAFYLPLAAPVVVALALAAAARQLTDQLEPRMATWLLTGAAAVLAGCLTGVLGLLALGGAARMPLVAGLGRMSLHVLQRDDPVPSLAAVGAASRAASAATVCWWLCPIRLWTHSPRRPSAHCPAMS
jgi:hypothetical protein